MTFLYIVWLVGLGYFLGQTLYETHKEIQKEPNKHLKDILRLSVIRDLPALIAWPVTVVVEALMDWKAEKSVEEATEDNEEDNDV